MASLPSPPPRSLRRAPPRWMATLSDLVLLLLTFFVLLVSMADFDDRERVDAIVTSIRGALGGVGLSRPLAAVPQQDATQVGRGRDAGASVWPIATRLEALADEIGGDAQTSVVLGTREVRLRLRDRVLFEPGADAIHPSSLGLLATVAQVMDAHGLQLRVEASSATTGSASQPWQAASSRAVAVVQAIAAQRSGDTTGLAAVVHAPDPDSVAPDEDAASIQMVFVASGAAGSTWLQRLDVLEEADAD